jgi:hypothetical protein
MRSVGIKVLTSKLSELDPTDELLVFQLIRYPQGLVEIVLAYHAAQRNRFHAIGPGRGGDAVALQPRAKRVIDHRLERPTRTVRNVFQLSRNPIFDRQRGSHAAAPVPRRPCPFRESSQHVGVEHHDIMLTDSRDGTARSSNTLTAMRRVRDSSPVACRSPTVSIT